MDRSYPAIWSASLGAVECELRSVYDKVVMAVLSEAQLLRIVLLRFGKNPEDMRAENRIEIPSAGGPRITLGPCSEAFAIHFDTLMYAKDVDPYFKLYELMEGAGVKSDKFYEEAYEVIGVDHRLTLRIEDVEVTSDDDAREVLMWVGNGALFELDVVPGLGLAMPLLSQQREDSYVHPAELASSRQPRRDYDPQPLFLYWHARSIPETPLVQFLNYYQVLEYYFPAYARTKTIVALREKLREIYGVARDADVAGILQALRANRRAIFGGEKDQLRHTIEQCVGAEELREFLGENERARFYNDSVWQEISTVRLPVGSADQRNDVAQRIYEIRNRIVHTKSEHDDLDPLLPLDPEVELLRHDIELVRFLARKVLATSARPLEGRFQGVEGQ